MNKSSDDPIFTRAEERSVVVSSRPDLSPYVGSRLSGRDLERFRRDFHGLDVLHLEREFQGWIAERDEPKDYVAAFYGFMKKKKESIRYG